MRNAKQGNDLNNIQSHVHVTILTIIYNNNHCCEYDWTPYQEKYKLDIDNPIKKDLTNLDISNK